MRSDASAATLKRPESKNLKHKDDDVNGLLVNNNNRPEGYSMKAAKESYAYVI